VLCQERSIHALQVDAAFHPAGHLFEGVWFLCQLLHSYSQESGISFTPFIMILIKYDI
jgi:hypothetical protein